MAATINITVGAAWQQFNPFPTREAGQDYQCQNIGDAAVEMIIVSGDDPPDGTVKGTRLAPGAGASIAPDVSGETAWIRCIESPGTTILAAEGVAA